MWASTAIWSGCPVKSLMLSNQCWPDVILGPVPHFYPFIVNDPGEGAQAKRRAQAVIIDHLMPPLMRAETYGELVELEKLVDEYYDAISLDPVRSTLLKKNKSWKNVSKTTCWKKLQLLKKPMMRTLISY